MGFAFSIKKIKQFINEKTTKDFYIDRFSSKTKIGKNFWYFNKPFFSSATKVCSAH